MRLWRLNVYGTITARLLFDAAELETFMVFNYEKLPKIQYKSLVYSGALYNNLFVRIWIFLSTSFKKTGIGTVCTPRTICAWLWVFVCQGMCGCFHRSSKKSLGLFLMSSKAWKLNSTTECFVLCFQYRPTLRAGPQPADIFRGGSKWL